MTILTRCQRAARPCPSAVKVSEPQRTLAVLFVAIEARTGLPEARRSALGSPAERDGMNAENLKATKPWGSTAVVFESLSQPW